MPHYAEWYRFWLFWSTAEGLLETVEVQDGWSGAPGSVGPLNEDIRVMLVEYLKEATGCDAELLEKMTPNYPPFSKRFVRDNGILPATFARDDVTLEFRPIGTPEYRSPEQVERSKFSSEIDVMIVRYESFLEEFTGILQRQIQAPAS